MQTPNSHLLVLLQLCLGLFAATRWQCCSIHSSTCTCATSSLPFGWARQLTNKRIMPTWSDRLGFRSAASSGSEATARWVEGMRSPAGINSQRQEIRWWRTWLAGWLAGWLTVLHFGAWKNRRIGEIWLDCWLLLHSIVTGEFLLWKSLMAHIQICLLFPSLAQHLHSCTCKLSNRTSFLLLASEPLFWGQLRAKCLVQGQRSRSC